MGIQPRYMSLQGLLSNRLFSIPQYQRSYSWDTRQLRELFEDIKRSYEAEGSKYHYMATVVALAREPEKIPGIAAEHQRVDIVDGQQRITTLILLLKAVSKALDRSDTVQKSLRSDIEKTLVKADSVSLLLLQTNHDSSHYFANYIREGEFVDSNDANTLADRRLLGAMKECENFVRVWQDESRSLEDLIAHLYNRLTFIYHEINDEGLVYTVFEVLNSRGLPVSWFDRLKSMLMAIVFESKEAENRSEIIDEVHSLWSGIYSIIGLRIGMSTESLRFAATLHSNSVPSKPPGERDAVDLLHEIASGGPSDVIKVTNWIKSVTKAVDTLHENPRLNAVTDIQQSRLVATAINLRKDFGTIDKERILRRWENVTFRIYGMSGKDARTAVGDYTRLAWRIVNDGEFSPSRIITELGRIGRDYPIDKAVEELRQTNCYDKMTGNELRYFFHRYEEHLARRAGQMFDNKHWSHIWAEDAYESIEHILPQSKGWDHVHWLGNLLLLPPRLNSTLRDDPPKQKAESYKKTGMRIAVESAKQVSGGWGKKDIKRRDEALLEWASSEWAD